MTSSWRPAAPIGHVQLRARLLTGIRAFFARRGVLEVDTPALSCAGITDPNLSDFAVCDVGPGAAHGRTLRLHTSPEFPMKRLLAAGSGAIYQICKVFRQGEAGRFHNPEFTMLEWYRPGLDHHALMDEVEELLNDTIGAERGLALAKGERLSYRELFTRFAGVDPFAASITELGDLLQGYDIHLHGDLEDDRDAWLNVVLTHVIEPQMPMNTPLFVYDYPASQAALARLRDDGEFPVAERFELYLGGVELANGFHELGDANEQRCRFEAENQRRRRLGLEEALIDENLLAALEYGLPDCAGVAMGIDRLVMLAAGADTIDEVIAFPINRV